MEITKVTPDVPKESIMGVFFFKEKPHERWIQWQKFPDFNHLCRTIDNLFGIIEHRWSVSLKEDMSNPILSNKDWLNHNMIDKWKHDKKENRCYIELYVSDEGYPLIMLDEVMWVNETMWVDPKIYDELIIKL